MPLQAILFDVDGTLADTESHGHRRAYNRAFRDLGLHFRWGPRLYRKLLKQPGGKERLEHFLRQYQPHLGDHADAVGENPRAWIEHVHGLKSLFFRRLVQAGALPLRPGVARLMTEAHAAGLKVGLVTNASRASLKPLLKHSLGDALAQRLNVVVCGEDVTHKKPAPDLYVLALSRLQLPAADCLAIEDSSMGLQSATAAGLATLITHNGDTESDDFAEAAAVLDSLGEPQQPMRVLRGALTGAVCVSASLLQNQWPILKKKGAHGHETLERLGR